MDNYDLESIEEDIRNILASNARSMNGTGSEDEVDDLVRELGERLGLLVYVCDGPNEYELDRDLLARLDGIRLGTIEMTYGSPTLRIEDPRNPENQLEIKIIDPTEQYF